jgi:hypothetical protein
LRATEAGSGHLEHNAWWCFGASAARMKVCLPFWPAAPHSVVGGRTNPPEALSVCSMPWETLKHLAKYRLLQHGLLRGACLLQAFTAF